MYAPESYQSTLEQMPDEVEIVPMAKRVFAQVFRTDFTAPGFALIRFRQNVDSLCLRRFMVALKDALDAIHREKRGRSLNCLSLTHFDHQTTTKFHLDGAPDESYLMLGYEPSEVKSELRMADYTRAAYDLNLTPLHYLTDYNPMYSRGEQQLASYTTRVEGFDTQRAHVLLINNSSLPFCPDDANTLGVMHQATILTPDPSRSRIVNSIMLTVSEAEDGQEAARALQQRFLTASS